MLHHAALIKSAVNRARALMRSGLLSDPAIAQLRQAKMLPSVVRMTHGLDVGSLNIIRKHNIGTGLAPSEMFSGKTIPRSYRYIAPYSIRPLEFRGLPPEEAAFVQALPSEIRKKLEGISGRQHLANFSDRPWPAFIEEVGRGNRPSKLQQWMNAAILRRHETDEARIALKLPKDAPRFRSHMSPEILVREARNIAGISPEVRDFWIKLRAGAYSPEADLVSLYRTKFWPRAGIYKTRTDINDLFTSRASPQSYLLHIPTSKLSDIDFWESKGKIPEVVNLLESRGA